MGLWISPVTAPFLFLDRLVPCSTLVRRTERRRWWWRWWNRRRWGQWIGRGYPLHPRASPQRDGGSAGGTGAHPQSLVFLHLVLAVSKGLWLSAHRSPTPVQPPGALPQEACQLPPVVPLIPVSSLGLQLRHEEGGQRLFGDRYVRRRRSQDGQELRGVGPLWKRRRCGLLERAVVEQHAHRPPQNNVQPDGRGEPQPGGLQRGEEVSVQHEPTERRETATEN